MPQNAELVNKIIAPDELNLSIPPRLEQRIAAAELREAEAQVRLLRELTAHSQSRSPGFDALLQRVKEAVREARRAAYAHIDEYQQHLMDEYTAETERQAISIEDRHKPALVRASKWLARFVAERDLLIANHRAARKQKIERERAAAAEERERQIAAAIEAGREAAERQERERAARKVALREANRIAAEQRAAERARREAARLANWPRKQWSVA
jgi:hypothetical protein